MGDTKYEGEIPREWTLAVIVIEYKFVQSASYPLLYLTNASPADSPNPAHYLPHHKPNSCINFKETDYQYSNQWRGWGLRDTVVLLQGRMYIHILIDIMIYDVMLKNYRIQFIPFSFINTGV